MPNPIQSLLHKLRGPAYPLLNLLLFKLSWLLLVVGQHAGLPWALALQALSVALHPRLKAALLPAVGLATAGIAMDLLLLQSGLFVFPDNRFPAWLVLLWLAFAFALPQGLGFLGKQPLPLQVLVGAMLGPLSYGIGARLDAVSFGLPLWSALGTLGVLWALYLPLALRSQRWHLKPAAALLLGLWLPLPDDALADDMAARQTLVGQAELRWLFRPIYEAYLYADTVPFRLQDHQGFTFELKYRLDLKRQQIVQETLRQWQKQDVAADPQWIVKLEALIPDIKAGDSLALDVDASRQAQLLHNGRPLGRIDDPHFVTAFAGIWLAENTTRPDLRQQLLGLP